MIHRCCAYCKHWTPWKEVLVSDDAPQMLGYCEIADMCVHASVPGRDNLVILMPTRQGLTASDYVCDSFKEIEGQT